MALYYTYIFDEFFFRSSFVHQKTGTGDTLVSSQAHVATARQRLAKRTGNIVIGAKSTSDATTSTDGAISTNSTKPTGVASHVFGPNTSIIEEEDEDGDNESIELLQEEEEYLLVGVKVPDPVFFCSIGKTMCQILYFSVLLVRQSARSCIFLLYS